LLKSGDSTQNTLVHRDSAPRPGWGDYFAKWFPNNALDRFTPLSVDNTDGLAPGILNVAHAVDPEHPNRDFSMF
jgi:hypothetical protein